MAAVAALPLIVGLNRVEPKESVWSSTWFVVGFALGVIALACLHRAYILFVAHRHAEKHMCPNPDAHAAAPAPRAPSPAPLTIISVTDRRSLATVIQELAGHETSPALPADTGPRGESPPQAGLADADNGGDDPGRGQAG
jgi:hypothetical protein